jgi:hypothetical protein
MCREFTEARGGQHLHRPRIDVERQPLRCAARVVGRVMVTSVRPAFRFGSAVPVASALTHDEHLDLLVARPLLSLPLRGRSWPVAVRAAPRGHRLVCKHTPTVRGRTTQVADTGSSALALSVQALPDITIPG